MSNTLTNLIPDINIALDYVSRELTGILPACMIDARADRAAVGQTVRIPQTASASPTSSITPAAYGPDPSAKTVGNKTLSISNEYAGSFYLEGEEVLGLSNAGTYLSVRQQLIAQEIRGIVNAMESDLANVYKYASRAYGTAGTNPFASSIDSANEIRQILVDNGCPMNDLHLCVNTSAGTALRNLLHLNQANTAGTDATLRQGVLLPISGMDIRESAQIASHTAGGGSSYVSNGIEAVGQTTLTIKTGSGTVLAGDVITFANDDNKYVVTTGTTAAGDIVIGAPGLLDATADGEAMSIGSSYTANFGFHRGAVLLATRQPALPEGGDAAVDRMAVTDPNSGITLDVGLYKQYRREVVEIAVVWGYTVIKPEHVAVLIG